MSQSAYCKLESSIHHSALLCALFFYTMLFQVLEPYRTWKKRVKEKPNSSSKRCHSGKFANIRKTGMWYGASCIPLHCNIILALSYNFYIAEPLHQQRIAEEQKKKKNQYNVFKKLNQLSRLGVAFITKRTPKRIWAEIRGDH